MSTLSTTVSLRGSTILLTRPRHQSQDLETQVTQLGGCAILFPSIAITDPRDKSALAEKIKNLSRYNLLIFTSPNAVFRTADLIRGSWPLWPKALKVAAIGRSTAKALKQFQLPVDYVPPQAFNSTELLGLPALQAVAGCQILLVKGEGGRAILDHTLQQRGAQVSSAIAYRRTLPPIDLSPLMPYAGVATTGEPVFDIDIIISTSQTGLENLLALFPQSYQHWLKNTQLLVNSLRLAAYAPVLGFVKAPLIADNAIDGTLIQELLAWAGKLDGRLRQ